MLHISDEQRQYLELDGAPLPLIFAVLAPIIAWVADLHGLSRGFLTIGIGGSVVFVAVFIAMRSVWSKIPK